MVRSFSEYLLWTNLNFPKQNYSPYDLSKHVPLSVTCTIWVTLSTSTTTEMTADITKEVYGKIKEEFSKANF